ncbi:PID-CTERM protein-sorting domain-containing protein [Tamlana flava]|uniref:PID-CTERM protein-sorting domain-containing protein n=1 Tax=Tamlana flava TaxID=3158572 RepID=UPI00351B336A
MVFCAIKFKKFYALAFFHTFVTQMTIQYKRILASILFVLISFICSAQGGPILPPPGTPPPPPGLPIDGGVFLGMVFALFYGVKKLVLKREIS